VVYGGGVLALGEVAAITLPDGELAGYEFVEPGEVAERVSPLPTRRIAACVDAVVAGHESNCRSRMPRFWLRGKTGAGNAPHPAGRRLSRGGPGGRSTLIPFGEMNSGLAARADQPSLRSQLCVSLHQRPSRHPEVSGQAAAPASHGCHRRSVLPAELLESPRP